MTGDLKPIRATLRLRNHRLTTLREELGMSQAAFATAAGVHVSLYSGLETMRESPLRVAGDWRPIARRVAAYHGVDPAVLWPDSVLGIQRTVFVREVSAEEAKMIEAAADRPQIGPGDPLDHRETLEVLQEAVGRLNPRERTVIRRRFGLPPWDRGQTIDEIADALRFSRTWISHVERRALRRLWGELNAEGFDAAELLRSARRPGED